MLLSPPTKPWLEPLVYIGFPGNIIRAAINSNLHNQEDNIVLLLLRLLSIDGFRDRQPLQLFRFDDKGSSISLRRDGLIG